MKKFKVNYTMKSGHKTHRYFLAPNLPEAQAQFNAGSNSATDCEWSECPYIDMRYKDMKTGEEYSDDMLYAKYIKLFPTRQISFVTFRGRFYY